MSSRSFLPGLAVLCLTGALLGVPFSEVLARSQEPNLQAPAGAQGAGAKAPPVRSTRDFLGLGPAPDAAAAKWGEPLYKANCSACHGPTARGAQGPNLVRSVLVLHDEKGEEIAPVVKNGRASSGMPAFPQLSETEIYGIAEYIHLQIELAANRGLYSHSNTMTSGDAQKGKAYFEAHCATCHSVTGDLAGIAGKYPQPSAMLARLAWPSSRGAREATVTLASGEKMTGTLAHYDDFETSLKTAAGKVETWPTATVKVDIPDKLAGHRALLPKYSDDDLHNLTQYLLSLK
ncbi:MAG: hypothetical protein JWM43_3025 [Acidobacteriaceae bacterium]|nr:hypothetical protein [Acidobacteriaceae bacterium]